MSRSCGSGVGEEEEEEEGHRKRRCFWRRRLYRWATGKRCQSTGATVPHKRSKTSANSRNGEAKWPPLKLKSVEFPLERWKRWWILTEGALVLPEWSQAKLPFPSNRFYYPISRRIFRSISRRIIDGIFDGIFDRILSYRRDCWQMENDVFGWIVDCGGWRIGIGIQRMSGWFNM